MIGKLVTPNQLCVNAPYRIRKGFPDSTPAVKNHPKKTQYIIIERAFIKTVSIKGQVNDRIR